MDIKSLKDKILQLAIQGKLVAQDERNEPVEIILERIADEKEQLIKDKKIKKEKPLPKIAEEEKLFELPKGWEWCRLNDICKIITDGTHSTPKYTESGVPFISVKDITKGIIDFSDTRFISREEHEVLIKRCNPEFGDVLLTKVGTTGIAKVVDTKKEFSIFVSVALLKLFNEFINEKYIELLINSPFVKKQSEDGTQGVGNKNLVIRTIKNFIIPIPPLEEQKRIVAKVDELFELIDELDSNRQDVLKNINDTRNKVLQLAIQGKLVEQCSDDEPASILLEKIKEEKEQLIKDKVIKKEKSLPEINEEEKQFELPNGWEWCRLGQISNYIKAGRDKPKDFSIIKSGEYRIPVIANGKTNTGIVGYTKIPTENNVCITVSGRGTIGYSCIRKEPFCPIVRLIVIHPSIGIDISYLNYALQHLVEQGVGTSIQQLTVPMIKPKVVPLPPLEEQKRIVAKVDLIMDYLDKLQQEIESQEIILEDIL